MQQRGPSGERKAEGERCLPPGRKSQSGFTGCERRALGKHAEAGQHLEAKETAVGCEEVGECLKEHTDHYKMGFSQDRQRKWLQKCHVAQEGQFSCEVCSREAKQDR